MIDPDEIRDLRSDLRTAFETVDDIEDNDELMEMDLPFDIKETLVEVRVALTRLDGHLNSAIMEAGR